MPIYKGSTKLGTIYHSGTKIEKVYKGSTLVYQTVQKFTMYGFGDSSNPNWTEYWAMGTDGSPLISSSDHAAASSSDDNINQLSRLVSWGSNKDTIQIYENYNSYSGERTIKTATYNATKNINGFVLREYKYASTIDYVLGDSFAYVSENQQPQDTILLFFNSIIDSSYGISGVNTKLPTSLVKNSRTMEWIYRP